MKYRLFILGFLCIAIIGGVILPDAVIGQLSGRSPIPQEPLRGTQGETFEILPFHSLQNPRFSWIMMQEKKFMERTESPIFRTRFTEVGTYTLNVEVTSEDGGTKIRRVFEIDVGKPAEPQNENEDVLVTLDPKTDGQSITLSHGKSVVLLLPTKKVRMLAIDHKPSLDTNGDGNTKNDDDAADTSFGTEGSPLYLWFASPITSESIIIHTDGKIQEFFVVSPEFSRSGEEDNGNVHINAVSSTGRNILFSAEFTEGQKPESPFLFYWNFGDGKESLLENPTHQYSIDGEYDVQLTIRNLESGIILMNTKKKITVQEGMSNEKNGDEKIFSGRIFMIVGSIVGLLLFFGGIFILLTRFVRKKVQSPIPEASIQKPTKKSARIDEEKIEKKEVLQKGGEPEESAEDHVEDLVEDHERSRGEQNQEEESDELTKDVQKIANEEEESQRSKEKVEEKGVTSPDEESVPIDITNAPAWLQKGLDVPIGSQKQTEENTLGIAPPDTFDDGTTPPQPKEPQTEEQIAQEPTPEWLVTPSSTPDSLPPPPLPEPEEQISTSPLTQETPIPTTPPSPQLPTQLLHTQLPKKRRRRRPRNRNRSNVVLGAMGTPQRPVVAEKNIPLQDISNTPSKERISSPRENTPILEESPPPLPVAPVSPSPEEEEPVAYIQVDSIQNAPPSPPIQEKTGATDEEDKNEQSDKTS